MKLVLRLSFMDNIPSVKSTLFPEMFTTEQVPVFQVKTSAIVGPW